MSGYALEEKGRSATREVPPVPRSTVLVVEVGSGAHGTGLPGREDHDETVIWIEPPEDVFALRDYEPRAVSVRSQPEGVPSGPGDTDRNLYTLRRFLNLASAGNPSIMLVLWGPIMQSNAIGEELRAMAPAFIGRHIIPKYRGYMKAQRDRLLGLRGGRHGAMRETDAGFDTKYAMHAARLGFQGIEILQERRLTLPIPGAVGAWLRAVRRGEVPLDAIISRIDALDRRLEQLADDQAIPVDADRGRIVEWSRDTHLAYWQTG
jgi:hypothetical protein